MLVTLKELRKALAELYSDEDSIRTFIDFGCTTIKSVAIDFRGSALVMWAKVLTEAMKHSNGITEIITNANEEYPDNKLIQDACIIGVEYDAVIKEQEYVPFKNILKHINKEKFGEIRRVDCNRSEQVKQYYKSKDDSFSITYSIGTIKDKPNSFAERIMLEILNDSKKDTSWLYRKPNGDKRIDEIPFEVRPTLELSQNLFCKQMELLFEGLNMDEVKEYFAHQNYKRFSLSLNFDYSLGDEILEPFTEWIYTTFSGIKETSFQFFFILTGFQSLDLLQTHIDSIIKSLDNVPIIPIRVINPVQEVHIQNWKRKINLDSYTEEEFISDLNYLKIPEEKINEFKKTKEISMQVMEIFQNNLYDSVIKTYKRHE